VFFLIFLFVFLCLDPVGCVRVFGFLVVGGWRLGFGFGSNLFCDFSCLCFFFFLWFWFFPP